MIARAGNVVGRCEGMTAAGKQCKCWAVTMINGLFYCRPHAMQELAVAATETKGKV